MLAEKNKAASEEEVSAVIENYANAIRSKDAEAVVSHYTTDLIQFLLAPPLEYEGVNKSSVQEWFSSFHGPVGYEIRDLKITAGDEIAFAHSLNRISGTRNDGGKTDIWIRETLCFLRIDGKWKISHEHESVPFYMDGTSKAAIDLKP